MNLTRFTDFGLRTLLYLAAQPPERQVTIGEVVDYFSLSKNHVVKVVHRLATLGYLETTRGRNGGIRLARELSSICIGDVVRHMEPQLEPVDCHKPPCRLRGGCGLKVIFDEAMSAFMARLDRYSLRDLVQQKGGMKAVFQISP